jgi:hypothetical protein
MNKSEDSIQSIYRVGFSGALQAVAAFRGREKKYGEMSHKQKHFNFSKVVT